MKHAGIKQNMYETCSNKQEHAREKQEFAKSCMKHSGINRHMNEIKIYEILAIYSRNMHETSGNEEEHA